MNSQPIYTDIRLGFRSNSKNRLNFYPSRIMASCCCCSATSVLFDPNAADRTHILTETRPNDLKQLSAPTSADSCLVCPNSYPALQHRLAFQQLIDREYLLRFQGTVFHRTSIFIDLRHCAEAWNRERLRATRPQPGQ